MKCGCGVGWLMVDGWGVGVVVEWIERERMPGVRWLAYVDSVAA